MKLSDQRLTKDGVIVIKAAVHLSQEQNREEALQRLQDLIKSALALPKPRNPSKPTRSSQRKRLDNKTKRCCVCGSRSVPKGSMVRKQQSADRNSRRCEER